MRRLSLRLALLFLAAMLIGAALQLGLTHWPLPQLMSALNQAWGTDWRPPAVGSLAAWAATALLALPLALALATRIAAPWRRLLRALEGAVLSYRDGDFSTSIAVQGHGELAELTHLHNALGQALREQRQHLAQRELLLDTVVQHTPIALVLTDGRQRVVYANLAARQLLGAGRSLEGGDFPALLQSAAPELRAAIVAGRDALFGVPGLPGEGGEESYHLLVREVNLQGRMHRLHLLRRMTRELSRQEVATWKRVIRVMSHELNNSLAPISSLAHTGAELARRGEGARLAEVFAAIGERSRHLHGFLEGYARFARLPAPRPVRVDWRAFLEGLAVHSRFRLEGGWPERPVVAFDTAQMEQALINLLKNAHEAGGDPDAVTLALPCTPRALRIEVADRGPGMSDTVLAQALLPFYSTKRDGSGLGLALAREIAEAHGGRIALAKREGGGLVVTMELPLAAPAAERPGDAAVMPR